MMGKEDLEWAQNPRLLQGTLGCPEAVVWHLLGSLGADYHQFWEVSWLLFCGVTEKGELWVVGLPHIGMLIHFHFLIQGGISIPLRSCNKHPYNLTCHRTLGWVPPQRGEKCWQK